MVNRTGRRDELERHIRKVRRRLTDPLRNAALWAMRRYLRWAGGATRNGTADGYIVAMTAEQYHRYTVLAREDQDFAKMLRILRGQGWEL